MQSDPKATEASALEEFRSTFLPRQIEAETAIHNGDPEPRLALWSTNDPVSLFGAWGGSQAGTDEVTAMSRTVASHFSDVEGYGFEVVAAGVSGDLAYTVGFERYAVSYDDGPLKASKLRVTHVYRRENGDWKIVHRHGDMVPVEESPPAPSSSG